LRAPLSEDSGLNQLAIALGIGSWVRLVTLEASRNMKKEKNKKKGKKKRKNNKNKNKK
jgi:hypothetical protein